MLRIGEVMGATVTLFSRAIAESRVKMSTGRRLFGAGHVYQHTAPRFTGRPNPVDRAMHGIRLAEEVVRCQPLTILPLPPLRTELSNCQIRGTLGGANHEV